MLGLIHHADSSSTFQEPMVSLRNRTEPSAECEVAPPGCRLAAPVSMAKYRRSGIGRRFDTLGREPSKNTGIAVVARVPPVPARTSSGRDLTIVVCDFSPNSTVWHVPSVIWASRHGESGEPIEQDNGSRNKLIVAGIARIVHRLSDHVRDSCETIAARRVLPHRWGTRGRRDPWR